MATAASSAGETTIEGVAITISRDVQKSFARLISQLPGRFARPSQLQHCLQIDAKLAWQVFKIAKAENPLEAVRYLPSVVSIKRLSAAAKGKGVSKDVLEAVEEAVNQFDVAVREHADGRDSFTSMVASLRNEASSDAVDLQLRRAAYRVNCQIWGSQIGVFFGQSAVRRRATGEIDASSLAIKADFRRLRADARPIVYGRSQRNSQGSLVQPKQVPIDPEANEKYGIPLLPQFCSQPIPTFGDAEVKDGWRIQNVRGEQMGRLGSVDLTVATSYKNSTLIHLSDGRKAFYTSLTFRVPTEMAFLELLIHRPSLGQLIPNVRVIPEFGVDFASELATPNPQIPSLCVSKALGAYSTAPPISELRDYDAATNHVLKTLDWDVNEFDVVRATLAYPVLNTTLVLWFEVPPALPPAQPIETSESA
jgi:hypothetical protein